MPRLLPMVLVLALLVASAAAFALTEGLKLTKSPIVSVKATVPFSPVCDCTKDRELISVRFRTADVVTVDILDGRGRSVRMLVDRHAGHARWNRFVWNGRTDDGAVAPDGTYHARVAFARAHKTITIPNPIVVDTQPPKVLAATPNRTEFSPDGDRQSDSVTIAYRLSERAHAALFLGALRIAYTHFEPRRGKITWYGRRDGVALPAGTYRVRVGATDVAGNVSTASDGVMVTLRVRYVEPTKSRYVELAGTRFSVRVSTDARVYSWRLGARSGVETAKSFVVRAPSRAGRYRLVLAEGGRSSSAVVLAEPRR